MSLDSDQSEVHLECKDCWFWHWVISSSKELPSDEESDITISDCRGVCKYLGGKFLFSCGSQRAVRQFERTVITRVVWLYHYWSRWKLCNHCKHFFPFSVIFALFSTIHFYIYESVCENCEKRLLPSSCPSVRLHVTTRLPLDGFSRNFISEYFFKEYVENIQVSLKSDKNNGYFAW